MLVSLTALLLLQRFKDLQKAKDDQRVTLKQPLTKRKRRRRHKKGEHA